MGKSAVIYEFGINLQAETMLTAKEIATQIGGILNLPEAAVTITNAAKLEEGDANSLGFLSNPKYEQALYETNCGAVIVPKDFKPQHPISAVLIHHDNPYFAFCTILGKYFDPNKHRTGIESNHIHETAIVGNDVHIGATAYIEENVSIGNNTVIYPGAYIGRNVKVGSNCIIYPNVVVYADCIVGNHCIVQAGSVIGGDGFGFAPVNGKYVKIPQVGNVVLEDWVEIGSNCSIDRATMGSTVIKTGTKLDNLVQIAHNVEVGEHTVIAAQTGISGSTKVGGYSQFGGQVGVAGHLTIANGVKIAGGAGVTKNLDGEGKSYAGFPAEDANCRISKV